MAEWRIAKVFLSTELLEGKKRDEYDSSDDDDDDEMIHSTMLLVNQINKKTPGVRIPGYFEAVIPRYVIYKNLCSSLLSSIKE